MGPPLRQCGQVKRTELYSESMRALWADREGDCWEWHGNIAYWKFCCKCHMCRWPGDERKKNSVAPRGISPELRGIAGHVFVWLGSLVGIAGRGQVHLQGARADRLAGQHGPAGRRDGLATGQKPGIAAGPLSCVRC